MTRLHTPSAESTAKIERLCEAFTARFRKLVMFHTLFHCISLTCIMLSVYFFAYTLFFYPRSLLLALAISTLILSVFSYSILRLYFQARKPQQYTQLRSHFLRECNAALPQILRAQERALSLAHAAYTMSLELNQCERSMLPRFVFFDSAKRLAFKISTFIFAEDVLLMRELFLLSSINEHILLVKKNPTDLEIHASLAHAYLALSRLYQDCAPKFREASSIKGELITKFTQTVRCAIEEFSIMDHFAPNDPWVHAQLASSYHALEEYENELSEYESILAICPHDKEIMHRLGLLYFKLGKNAKGLRIYQRLKEVGHPKANDLIHFYDARIRDLY